MNSITNNRLKIYVTHSTAFNYQVELYQPLRLSSLNSLHEIILPHENINELIYSKSIIRQADLVLAEVSYPSTGQGIELGWADMLQVPIICFAKMDRNYSSSLKLITQNFITYGTVADLLTKFEKCITTMRASAL